MTTLTFEDRITWTGAGRQGSGVVHTGGQAVACSAPASMGGKGEGTSPEDLLVSAVASCYTATLASLLAKGGLPVLRVEVAAAGTVADLPARARVSEIRVAPTFVGADEQRRAAYETAARTARDRCFIGNHLAPDIAYEVGEVAFAAAAVPDGLLDVRTVPPGQRHALIFAALDRLAAGEAVTLVNDHDPIPLRYQLEATRGPACSWDYLEQGPTTWRVRIARRA